MNKKQKMLISNIIIFCSFILTFFYFFLKLNSLHMVYGTTSVKSDLIFVTILSTILVLFIVLTLYIPLLFVLEVNISFNIKPIEVVFIKLKNNVIKEYRVIYSLNKKLCVYRC